MIGPGAATIVYDGSCRMCARSVALLLRYDGANRLSAVPGGPATLERFGTAADDAMYVVAGGRRYRGYWAFHAVFERLPGLGGIAWTMGRGPAAAAGPLVYAWIARHRGLLRWIVPALHLTLALAGRSCAQRALRHGRRAG